MLIFFFGYPCTYLYCSTVLLKGLWQLNDKILKSPAEKNKFTESPSIEYKADVNTWICYKFIIDYIF